MWAYFIREIWIVDCSHMSKYLAFSGSCCICILCCNNINVHSYQLNCPPLIVTLQDIMHPLPIIIYALKHQFPLPNKSTLNFFYSLLFSRLLHSCIQTTQHNFLFVSYTLKWSQNYWNYDSCAGGVISRSKELHMILQVCTSTNLQIHLPARLV